MRTAVRDYAVCLILLSVAASMRVRMYIVIVIVRFSPSSPGIIQRTISSPSLNTASVLSVMSNVYAACMGMLVPWGLV